MSEFAAFPADYFNQAGLNRQHVFDLAALPAAVQETLAAQEGERQLVLFGHGGRRLWECVQTSGSDGADPIDDYCIKTISEWFAAQAPALHYRILYPGNQSIALQALGKLAGWHHAAPFMVGIDAKWGSWFAYRAVVIADTNFCPDLAVDRAPKEAIFGGSNPCLNCTTKPCIAACPAQAMRDGTFALEKCLDHRRENDSSCAQTCLARLACPVGKEHRYSAEQMRHSYLCSLKMIRELKMHR